MSPPSTDNTSLAAYPSPGSVIVKPVIPPDPSTLVIAHVAPVPLPPFNATPVAIA